MGRFKGTLVTDAPVPVAGGGRFGGTSIDTVEPDTGLASMESPPDNAVPGSPAYAKWAAARARAGKKLPQVSAPPPEWVQPEVAAAAPVSLGDATLATIGGITSSLPFLTEASDALIAGGQTALDAATGQPVDFGARYGDLRERRDAIAERAPIADIAGKVAGVIGTAGAIGSTKAGAEALGMSGPWAKQLLNSVMSTAAYEGTAGLSKGHTGTELLADMGIGAAGGVAGFGAGKVVEGAGQAVADALTNRAQNALTKEALARGAPDAAALRREGSGYFQTSVDENPVMITGDAYHRLLGNIQRSTERFRPNQLNNSEAVGLLQKFWQVADDINTPGSNAVVDLKDLHILRQAAVEVTQGNGSQQTKTIASKVVRQLDRFIKTLRKDDTVAGLDPEGDAHDLMRGISTWARASKVKTIEDAIDAADTYKSGFENGLKHSFLRLMKDRNFKTTFSKPEQDAIRKVAHGSKGQNIAEAIGRLGISFSGGGAHNIVGGSLGTAGATAALTPLLGPLALPAAVVGTTVAGAAGRKVAETLGRNAAERAANIAATPGIRTARPRQNALEGSSVPISTLARLAAVTGHD